jgi:UTP-glucose-1-phosphate uridylyltransferase
MNNLRQQGHLRACLLSGKRYDIGHPKDYARTFNKHRRSIMHGLSYNA